MMFIKTIIQIWVTWQMIVGILSFEFKQISINVSPTTINTPATYTITIQRNYNSILAQTNWNTQLVPANSNIIISFPIIFTGMSTPTCSLIQINDIDITGYSCAMSFPNITISNAIGSSALAVSNVLVVLTNVINPSPAVSDLGSFITYIGNDNSANISSGVELTPGTFSSCTTFFNPAIVNQTGTMIFQITPLNSIPASGQIQIGFPNTLQWKNDISTNHPLPINGVLSCSSFSTNVNAALSCIGQASTFSVKITNIFTTNISSTFSFGINGMFTPPTTQPIDIITIRSYIGSNPIDQCTSSISSLQPQSLNVSIASTTTMLVNARVGLRFTFTTTDTISRNDIFLIQFPTGTSINFTTSSGTFSLTGLYNATSSQLVLTQATSSATRFAPLSSTIIFINYVAPPSTRTTSPITLQIMFNGYPKMLGSNTLTAIAKSYSATFSASNNTINTISSYTLSFVLSDPLQSNGFIRVTIPSSLIILSNLTVTMSSNSSNINPNPSFSINSSIITITNINTTSANIPSQSLTITLSSLVNPNFVQNITLFTFKVYYSNDVIDQVADGSTNTNFVQLSPANILSSSVTANNFVNLATNVTYDVIFANTNNIPISGYIIITFPNQVILPASLINCLFNLNSVDSVSVCSILSTNQVKVISPSLVIANSTIKISIPMCTNPSSTQPTNNFAISTFTNTNAAIDTLSLGPTISMNTPSAYSSITLSTISKINSAITTYVFTLKHQQLLSDQSVVSIKFPSQIQPPNSTFSCTNQLSITLICQYTTNNTITVVLNSGSISSVANYSYTISIGGVKNPPSLQPSSSFTIDSYTPNSTYSYTRDTTSLKVTNNILSNFPSLNYTFSKKILNQPTSLAITFSLGETTNTLEIKIAPSLTISTIACFSPQFTPQCSLNGTKLTVTNSPNLIPLQFTINITGLISPNAVPTDFTEVKSYNSNGFGISQSLESIIWPLQCSINCRTCSITNISKCLSCYSLPISTKIYLYQDDCLSNCPNLTVANSTTFTCDSCAAPCLDCSITVTNCTSCSLTNFLYNNTCYASCPNGTFTSNITCQQCPVNCTSCSSLVNCSACISDQILFNSSCVANCPAGYFNSTNSCLQCSSNCSTCSSLSNCTTCPANFSLYNFTCVSICPSGYFQSLNVCQQCSLICSTCSSLNNCTSCPTNQSLYNNTCLSSCPAGYFSSSSICLSCSSICSTCTSLNNCSSCPTNQSLFNNTCLSSCPSGYFSSSNVCLQCSTNCSTCSSLSNCTTCPSNNSLYNQTCVSICPSGYFSSLGVCQLCSSNCSTCSSLNNCTTCATNLTLFNNTCVSTCPAGYFQVTAVCQSCSSNCSTCSSLSNCTTCPANFSLYNFTCVSICPSGYFQSLNVCQQCSLICSTCSSLNNCTSCPTNQSLYNNTCLSSCPAGYFSSSSICLSCSSICSTCTSLNNCSSCPTNQSLFNNTCLSSCPSGYFSSSNVCLQCSTNCSTCSSLSNCTTCPSNNSLYNQTCVSICPSGYFSSLGVCQLCSSNCSTCSSLNNCTTCATNLTLFNNTCVSTCPAGYFQVTAVCQACPSLCSVCSSLLNCSSCLVNNYLFNFTCLSSCPNGYFPNGSICSVCSSNCWTCSSISNCTSCPSNQFLFNGSCIGSCPSGYFGSSGTCQQCSSGCITCSSLSNCTNCQSGQYLINNTCFSVCPSGYIIVSGNCTQCPSNCLVCTSLTQCTACQTNTYLYNNGCVPACPAGYYPSAGTCTLCPSNCSTCTSASSCQSCIPPLLLYLSTCVSACPVTHSPITNNTCTKCSTNLCSNCTPSDRCSSCESGVILFNNSCVSSCPNNYIFNGTTCTQYINGTLDAILSSRASIFPMPFTTIGFILFVGCLMSKLQYSNSYLTGTIYSLLGVVQTLSICYMSYIYWRQTQKQQLTLFLMVLCLAMIGGLNVISFLFQSLLLERDKNFSSWKNVSCNNTFYVITCIISLLTNYKFKMILFSRLFSFKFLRAQLDNVQKFRIFNLMSFIGILSHEALLLYVIPLAIINNKQISNITLFTFIDCLVITVVSIVLSLGVSKKNDEFFEEEDEHGLTINKKVKLEDESIANAPLDFVIQHKYTHKIQPHQKDIKQLEDQQLSLSFSQNNNSQIQSKKTRNIFEPTQEIHSSQVLKHNQLESMNVLNDYLHSHEHQPHSQLTNHDNILRQLNQSSSTSKNQHSNLLQQSYEEQIILSNLKPNKHQPNINGNQQLTHQSNKNITNQQNIHLQSNRNQIQKQQNTIAIEKIQNANIVERQPTHQHHFTQTISKIKQQQQLQFQYTNQHKNQQLLDKQLINQQINHNQEQFKYQTINNQQQLNNLSNFTNINKLNNNQLQSKQQLKNQQQWKVQKKLIDIHQQNNNLDEKQFNNNYGDFQKPLQQEIVIEKVNNQKIKNKDEDEDDIQEIQLAKEIVISGVNQEKNQSKIYTQIQGINNASKNSWIESPQITQNKKQRLHFNQTRIDQILEKGQEQQNHTSKNQQDENNIIVDNISSVKKKQIKQDQTQGKIDQIFNDFIDKQIDKSDDQNNDVCLQQKKDQKILRKKKKNKRVFDDLDDLTEEYLTNNIKQQQIKQQGQQMQGDIQNQGIQDSSLSQQYEQINFHPIKSKVKQKEILLQIMQKAQLEKMSYKKGQKLVKNIKFEGNQMATTLKGFNNRKGSINGEQTERIKNERPPRPSTSIHNQLYLAGLNHLNDQSFTKKSVGYPPYNRNNNMDDQSFKQGDYGNITNKSKSSYQPFRMHSNTQNPSKEISNQIDNIQFQNIGGTKPSDYDSANQRYVSSTMNLNQMKVHNVPEKPTIKIPVRRNLKSGRSYRSKDEIRQQQFPANQDGSGKKINPDDDEDDLRQYYSRQKSHSGSQQRKRSKKKSRSKSKQKPDKRQLALQKIYLQKLDVPKR